MPLHTSTIPSKKSVKATRARKQQRYCALLATVFLCQHSTQVVVESFVPPHPDSDLAETWEPVHHRRRRLQQQFNYEPRFVSPELCRFLSEKECKDVDDGLLDHAQRHRRLFETKQAPSVTNQEEGDDSNIRTDFDDHLQENGFSLPPPSASSTLLNNQIQYPATTSATTTNNATYTSANETSSTTISSAQSSSSSPVQRYNNNNKTNPLIETRRNPASIKHGDPDIEILVLLMRFQNHKNRNLPDRSVYDELWNDRIHRWFALNSYGHYRYHAHVTDWMDTDGTEEDFAAGVSGLRHSLQESFWPLLNTLNQDPSWDWSRFDRDGDGRLDAVVVLHSGYPAEIGGEDCTNDRQYKDRIWSHAFASSDTWTTHGIVGSVEYTLKQQQANVQSEQQSQQQAPPYYALHGYLIASGLDGVCGSREAKMGVITHEYLHTLGLDDIYDYGTNSDGKGVGVWDIMGYPYGPENDEDFPGHLSAYSKVSLGWLDPTPITWSYNYDGSSIIALRPAEISGDAIKIVLSNGATQADSEEQEQTQEMAVKEKLLPQYQNHNGKYEEYLLLENRQPLEFDRDLKEKNGLVVYHVDESVPRMNNPGYPGQSNWPQNGNHYRVAVLGADTMFHLERGINKGDPSDTWKPGRVLGPGSQGQSLPNNVLPAKKDENRNGGLFTVSYPNTDTYQYGIVRETGISIETLGETTDKLTVRISWGKENTVTERPEQEDDDEDEKADGEDCDNLLFWVELQVPGADGKLAVKAISCNEIGLDPEYYCGLMDYSMGWNVWEICRVECPESGCT